MHTSPQEQYLTMITHIGTMKPLPVRPVDGIATGAPADLSVRLVGGTMRPLPVLEPETADLAGAIRDAAFERMLERLCGKRPLTVVDPTA